MNVAIIQARMGSKRLPGKVLKPLDGKPMLKYQIERVIKARTIDKIVVATSTLDQDDIIYEFCVSENIECYRGSENDVLSRYYGAANKFHATNIIRLTADCPFSDPKVIDAVVDKLITEKLDYAANTVPPETSTFPDGSDVEVFTLNALTKAFKEAVLPADREHVTFYFWKGNEAQNFKTGQYSQAENHSKFRITVDYPEDYELAKMIVKSIGQSDVFGDLQFIIETLISKPELALINNKYYFGIGWGE
jgi:spore coat polysaccharide biosynthesis protein SpsF